MGDTEKKILGGLALAALILGTGGAGAGALGAAEGAGAAGAAGAEGAAAAATAAEAAAAAETAAAAEAGLAAAEGVAAAEGATAAELAAAGAEGATTGAGGSLGGAAGAEPAAGALGEGGGAALGDATAGGAYTPEELLMLEGKAAPVDFTKLMGKVGSKAGDAAIAAGVGQGIRAATAPDITTFGKMPFTPYQPTPIQPMKMTDPRMHLRSMGFA